MQLLTAAFLVLATGFATQAQTFTCTASAAAQPTLRARGRAELTSDLLLDCNGLRPSGGLTADAIIVTLNVPITSRILNASNGASEALLLLDNPEADNQRGQAIGGVAIRSPNVLQGRQTGPNELQWSGVSLAEENTGSSSAQRAIRITNIRANVSSLFAQAPVTATVTIQSKSTFNLNNPTQTLGTVGGPLQVSIRTPDDGNSFGQQVSGCTGKVVNITTETPRDFNIRFSESNANEFRRRGLATTASNPNTTGEQNSVQGPFGYGTESGFRNSSFPNTSGMDQAGLATQGTRLVARVTGLPPGSQIWVTVQPVIQGTSTTGITARLTSADENGAGTFQNVNPTAGSYAQLPITQGAATAVWEVFETNQSIQESLAFGFIVSLPANYPAAAAVRVAGLLGPGNPAANQAQPTPTFDTANVPSALVYDIRACVASLVLTQACPLPNATIGLAYSLPLSATGGVSPYQWSIGTGALPAGLSISTTGLISGTPTQPGIFNFALRVADSGGAYASQDCSMAVQAGVSITSACPLPDVGVGIAYAQTLAASGGTPPYTWAVIRGALPPGMQLGRTTGILSGASLSPGVYEFGIQATDTRGSSGQKDCALRVVAPVRLSSTSVNFRLPAQSTPPVTQIVSLSSDTSGQPWSAKIAGTPAPDWLRVTPAAGRTPAVLELTAAPGSLAPGDYTAQVTVTTQGAVQQSYNIDAALTVTAPLPADTTPEPTALMLSVPRGTAREERIIQINRQGVGVASFTAQVETETAGGWITLPAPTGDTTAAAPGRVRVLIQPGALSPGTYKARLLVDTPDSPRLVVPIVLGVTNSREAISVTPSVVNIRAVAGNTLSPSQFVNLTMAGSAPVNFQTSVLTDPGQTRWLTVTPAAGRVTPEAPIPIEVRANLSGLDVGRYSGEFVVTAPGVDNAPRLVLVNLEVLPATTLVYPETSGLVFSGAPGGSSTQPQSIFLTNAGRTAATFDYDVTGDAGIFAVTPQDRSVPPGSSVRVDITANPARLAAGVYSARLNMQTAGDPVVKSVDLRLILGPRPGGASTCSSGGLEILPVRVPYGFNATAGDLLPVEVVVYDTAGTPLTRGAVTAALTRSGTLTNLTSLGDGRWSGLVRAGADAGPTALSVLTEDRDRGISGCLDVPGLLTSAGNRPVVAEGGVLSTASFRRSAPVSAGGMVAIFGQRLAAGSTGALALPLPQQLGITRARIAATRIPLYFAADLGDFSQVNGILPYTLTPNVIQQLHVQTNAGTGAADVFLSEAEPAIYTATQRGAGQAIAVHGSNLLMLADTANPIQRGQVLIIYGEGLGPVAPPIEAGRATPANPLSRVAVPVRVTIGGQDSEVQFAGLTPGLAGLYQINTVVPVSVSPGNEVPLVVTVNGQSSPTVTLAVRP
ncbi:MAG: putative Ig domain-containing protein [Bryobacterales bacterium]|nr:putative Ig domain-containing protein [Bryobacterales bacterium]